MADNAFLKSPLEAVTDSLSSQAAPAPAIPETGRTQAKTSSLLPPSDLLPIFEASAKKFDVPVNVLMALAHQESTYNKNAIGAPTQWGRAKGMMQYLDGTAKDLGINPFNPDEAIPAAAQQLRDRLNKGYSIEDAVKEHFAGPDRKLWGEKTAEYGRTVMDKVGKIGELLGAGANGPSERVDLKELQTQLNKDDPGRYQVLDDNYISNHFSPALPRPVYEYGFKLLNPGADDAALKSAMQAYDATRANADQQKAQSVINKFDVMKSPEATFQQKLDARLAGPKNGILPQLPTRTDLQSNFKKEIEKESGGDPSWSDAGSYLLQSGKSGLYQMAGAAAKLLDEVNPWTLSESDAAVLFKNDPQKLKEYQDNSAAMILSRFANSMQNKSSDAMDSVTPGAKSGYESLRYATTDASKSAFLSPVRVIGDAVQSLPTMAAMAFSAYLTRGASTQAEKEALASGLSEEAARQAGIQAAGRVMANTSAATEGAVGYAQNALQTHQQVGQLSDADMGKSPMFQSLLSQGYSKEAARAKVVSDTADQSGVIAGIADAAANKVGGEFLGRLMTEGGKFVSRVMKGAATEGATEAVQSPAEQFGQNWAIKQNVNPNQSLSEGTGEAALQGLAVGGLSGGAFGGVAGHPVAEHNDAQREKEQTAPVQPAAPATETVTPPQPSASGPLTKSVEDVADQPERVKVATPAGEMNGFVQSITRDGQGNFNARILGDDGQVYQYTNADGAQITTASGPLTAAMEKVAAAQTDAAPEQVAPAAAVAEVQPAQTAAVPEVAPEQPKPAAPAELKLEGMTEQELRDRMKYLAGQAKNNGGWNKMLMTERRKVESQINKLKENPNGATSAPESTGLAEGAGERSGDNGAGSAGNGVLRDDVAGNTAGAGVAGTPIENAGQSGSVSDGNQQTAELSKDEYAGKRFSSKEKADALLAKSNAGETHEVVQTGKVRWEIKPKATVKDSLTAQPENVEAIDTSAKPVEKPQENVQVKSKVKAKTPSWVIKNKATGEVVMETYNQKKVDALNTEKYEAVPILEHLQSLNKKEKENGYNQRTSGEPNGSEAVAGKQAAERTKAGDANAASEEKAQGKKEVGAANNRTEAERELELIFKGLASRGKKTKQAAEAKVSGHPLEAQIRYVEQNFYELLSDLDESGLVKIVC